MRLKLIEKREINPGVISFHFQPEEPMTWKAGQFLKYQLPDGHPDERGTFRFFTIASAPSENIVQLTTKFAPDEGSTFKKDLKEMAIGAEIEAQPPSGRFVVEDPQKEYVFIAGGIGITPFRAILKELDSTGQPLNVTLLYANRDENIVFKEEFEKLQQTHPEFKIHYFIGDKRVDEAAIKTLIPQLNKPIYYISGPEPMVEGLEKTLIQMGIPDEQIKRDYFPGYQAI